MIKMSSDVERPLAFCEGFLYFSHTQSYASRLLVKPSQVQETLMLKQESQQAWEVGLELHGLVFSFNNSNKKKKFFSALPAPW